MAHKFIIMTVIGLLVGSGNVYAGSWSAEAMGEGSGIDRGGVVASGANFDLKASKRGAIEANLAEAMALNTNRLVGIDGNPQPIFPDNVGPSISVGVGGVPAEE